MVNNLPSKRLRAAASTACYQCKAAKKRCEGETPCDSCIRRGLSCTRPPADIPDGRIRLSFEDPETTSGGRQYMLDVHHTQLDSTVELLDQYFDIIAPIWPLVTISDLQCRPFASPLLVRSICLISAMASPEMDLTVVHDLTDSIYQCLAVDDLISSPSLPTLQALLLLLACPHFNQRSIVIASVIRMASILGLHHPQSERPIIYWTCVAWARWETIKSGPGHQGSSINHTSHLPTTSEPSGDYFFGRVYHLLLRAQSQGHHSIDSDFTILRPPEIQVGDETLDYLLRLLECYLFMDPSTWNEAKPRVIQDTKSPWFQFCPFYDILK